MASRPPALLQRPSRLHHVHRIPENEGNEAARPSGNSGTSQLDRRLAHVLQELRRGRNPHPQEAHIRVVERPSEIQQHLARVQRMLRRSRSSRHEDDQRHGVANRTSRLDQRLARVEQVLRRSRNSRPEGPSNRVELRRHRNRRPETVRFRLVERPSEIQDHLARVQPILRLNRNPRERVGASNRDTDRHSAVQRRLDNLRLRLMQRRLRIDSEQREARRGVSDLPLVQWQLARMQMRLRSVHYPRHLDNGETVAARRSALQRRLGRLQQVLRRIRTPSRQGVARSDMHSSVASPHRRRARLLQPVIRRLSPLRQHNMDFDEWLAEYRQIGAVQVTLRRLRELRRRHHRGIAARDRASAQQTVARIQGTISGQDNERNLQVSGDAIANRASLLNRRIARLHDALRRSYDQRSQEVSGNVEVDRDLLLDQRLMRLQEILRGENNQQGQDISRNVIDARISTLHQYRDSLREDLRLTDDQQNQELYNNDIVHRSSERNIVRLQDALSRSLVQQNREPCEFEHIVSMQVAAGPLVDQQNQEANENEILDRASEEVHEQNQNTFENETMVRASVEDMVSLQEMLRRSVNEQNQEYFENVTLGSASEEDEASSLDAQGRTVYQQNQESFEYEILDRPSVNIGSLPEAFRHEAHHRRRQASGDAIDDRASASHQGTVSLQADLSASRDQRSQEILENEIVDRASVREVMSLQEAFRRSEAYDNVMDRASASNQRAASLQDTIRDVDVPPPLLVGENVSVLSRRPLRWQETPGVADRSRQRREQPRRLQARLQRREAVAAAAADNVRADANGFTGRQRRISQFRRTLNRHHQGSLVQSLAAGSSPGARAEGLRLLARVRLALLRAYRPHATPTEQNAS